MVQLLLSRQFLTSTIWTLVRFTTLATDNMKMPYTIKLVVTKNEFSTGAIKYTLVGEKNGGNAGTGELAQVATWVDV